MTSLLDDLIAEADKLRSVDFTVSGEMRTIHYKLLTGKTYSTIRTLSKKSKITEGVEVEYIDEDALRVNTIITQSLDDKGVRIFGVGDFDRVSKIPYHNQCYLAAVMGLKSLSDIMQEATESLKKMQSQEQ